MKVNTALIHSLYFPDIIGGAEISTQILAETLGIKHDVNVITVGSQSSGILTETINGIRIHRLPYNNVYWFGDTKRKKKTLEKVIWRMRDIYNREQYQLIRNFLIEMRPDVMHTQNLPGLSLSAWKAAHDLNIPIVHTLRDYSLMSPLPIKSYSYIYRRLAMNASKNVAAVIGISKDVLDNHIDDGFFVHASKHIVPNAVQDSEAVDELYRNRSKALGQPLKIGYFGQVTAIKGVEHLVKAVMKTPHHIVEKLYICGEGSEIDKITALSKSDSRIILKGKLPKAETTKMMSQVDVTFVPSIWSEPFGRVIIESYQVGTPVYASCIGGIPEVLVDPGRFSFQPDDESAIAEKIMEFSRLNEEEMTQVREQCYQHSKKFNTDMLLLKHEEIYKNLFLKKKRET